MTPNDGVRLNKFIATRLNVGRRAADDLILSGKVRINGELPKLGSRVRLGDEVLVDGTKLAQTEQLLYVLMNKPVGYVCSRRQQGEVKTIYSLLPAKYQHLKTVGRLDKDSSGLIMLTNDGDFAYQLTHPSFVKTKQYEVALGKALAPLHRQMISDHGVMLPDGNSKLQLERLIDGDDTQWIIRMHEGRNRQIRRTFAALGYPVIGLHRTQFGSFSIKQLNGELLTELSSVDTSR